MHLCACLSSSLIIEVGNDFGCGIAAEAAARRIGVRTLSPMHLAPSDQRGLLLGYGRLPEHRIPRAVDALASLLVDVGVAKSQRHTSATAKR